MKQHQGWGYSSVIYLPSMHKTLALNFNPTKVSYLLLKGKGLTQTRSGTQVFAEALFQIAEGGKHHKYWLSSKMDKIHYDELLLGHKRKNKDLMKLLCE